MEYQQHHKAQQCAFYVQVQVHHSRHHTSLTDNVRKCQTQAHLLKPKFDLSKLWQRTAASFYYYSLDQQYKWLIQSFLFSSVTCKRRNIRSLVRLWCQWPILFGKFCVTRLWGSQSSVSVQVGTFPLWRIPLCLSESPHLWLCFLSTSWPCVFSRKFLSKHGVSLASLFRRVTIQYLQLRICTISKGSLTHQFRQKCQTTLGFVGSMVFSTH